MGHRYPDMDARFGFLGGLHGDDERQRMLHHLNPKEITADIQRALEELKNTPSWNDL